MPYPNGHRNVVFAQRGVNVLPISQEEIDAKVNTGPMLYPYLKQNRGICMLHSLATDQGSDYRDNDPEVEPLVEIYQGYHANYEYEGAPRAETKRLQRGRPRPVPARGILLERAWPRATSSGRNRVPTTSPRTPRTR